MAVPVSSFNRPDRLAPSPNRSAATPPAGRATIRSTFYLERFPIDAFSLNDRWTVLDALSALNRARACLQIALRLATSRAGQEWRA